MDDEQTRLSDIPPLGRSAEEVEAENANRVNPTTPREQMQDDLPPIPILGGTEGTPIVGRGNTSAAIDAEHGADTTRGSRALGDDSSDNTQS